MGKELKKEVRRKTRQKNGTERHYYYIILSVFQVLSSCRGNLKIANLKEKGNLEAIDPDFLVLAKTEERRIKRG